MPPSVAGPGVPDGVIRPAAARAPNAGSAPSGRPDAREKLMATKNGSRPLSESAQPKAGGAKKPAAKKG